MIINLFDITGDERHRDALIIIDYATYTPETLTIDVFHGPNNNYHWHDEVSLAEEG